MKAKILSVYLTLLIIMSAMLVPEVFSAADNTTAYNATLLDFYKASSTNTAFGVTSKRYDNTLSGIKSTTVNYGWATAALAANTSYEVNAMADISFDQTLEYSAGSVKVSFSKYVDTQGNILGTLKNGKAFDNSGAEVGNIYNQGEFIITEGSKRNNVTPNFTEFKEDEAVLFYVKMPSEAPECEWLFQMVGASMVKTKDGGEDVIYPAVGANDYIQIKNGSTVQMLARGNDEWETVKTNRSHIDGRLGHIVFPAGFEGWVRIPYSSFFNAGLSNYVYRINIRPKNLGGDYTADGVSFGSFMFVDNGNKDLLKAVVTESENDKRVADLVIERAHNSVTVLDTESVNSAEAVENETALSNGYTYFTKGKSALLNFTEDSSAKLSTGGAVILYVRQSLGENNKLSLLLNDKYGLKGEEPVYLLNRGERKWQAVSVDAEGKADIKDGFEGYVLAPTSSFDGAKGKKIESLKALTDNDGVYLGTVMLSKTAVTNAIDIRIDGEKNYINLYKKAYYNSSVINTEDAATNTLADKDYYQVSSKNNDASYSPGIDNGYYYEFSAGAAANGTYKEERGEVPPYTATAVESVKHGGLENNPPFTVTYPKARLSATPFTITGFTNSNLNTISVSKLSEGRDCFEFSSASGYQTMISGNTLFASNGFTQDSTDKALLFYVDHKNATEEIKFNILFNWYSIGTNKEYYTYNSKEAVWKKSKTTSSGYNSVQNLSSDSSYLTLPAEFTGWVMLPVNSLRTNVTELKNLRFSVYNLGGAAGSLVIGDFYLVDSIDPSNASAFESSMFVSNNYIPLGNDFPLNTESKTNFVISSPIGEVAGFKLSAEGEYSNLNSAISNGNTRTALYVNAGLGKKVNVNGSLLFYVDHSDATAPINLCLGIKSGWCLSHRNLPYYRFDTTKGEWEALTTTDKNSFGFMEIPAGFKGWIRIPISSFKSGNSTETTDFNQTIIRVYPDSIGGKYGSLVLGAITFLDEIDNRFHIKQGTADKQAICDESVINNSYKITVGDFLGEKYYVTEAPAGTGYTTIKTNNTAVINDGQALMFYVEKQGIVASSFRIDLGDSGMGLTNGSKYFMYDCNSQNWKGVDAGIDGRITVEQGFSGWIRIPYSSFLHTDTLEKATSAISFTAINILPYELGGKYGNLKIGTFMAVNNGSKELVTMRVDKNAEVPITSIKAYTGSQITFGDFYPMGENARAVTFEQTKKSQLSKYVNYTVTAKENDIVMNMKNAVETEVSTGITLSQSEAILFYVNLENSGENAVIIGNELELNKNAAYYLLGMGNSAEWQKETVESSNILKLPAGFEGWIRIPAASFKKQPENVKKFVFGFEKVYVNSSIRFGSFIVINNGKYDYSDIYFGGTQVIQSLLACDYSAGFVVQGNLSRSDDADGKLTVNNIGNILTPSINQGYAYEVSASGEPVVLQGSAYAPRTVFDIDTDYQARLSSAGGIMMYIEMPENVGNRFFLQVKAEDYGRLSEGAVYSLLQNGDAYWTTVAANSSNEILIPAGFKGWVKIDYNSITTYAGAGLKGAVSKLFMSWRKVGGNYGSPKIGTIAFLDYSADADKLKLYGMGEINLFGNNVPKKYDRDDVAVWESVKIPFDSYDINETFSISTAISSDHKNEANSKFAATVINDIPDENDSLSEVLDENGEATDQKTGYYDAPFGTRGLEFTSSEYVWIHGDHFPRFSVSMPFSLEGSKGLVFYLNIPETKKGGKSALFFQLRTSESKYYSVKYTAVIATLQDGATNWSNVTVVGQRINLPSGFEGYVYVPLSALETYKDSKGKNEVLSEYEVVDRVVFGFGEFGGSNDDGSLINSQKAFFGGMWLSKNGVLSHNGAFVDGADKARNVFTGKIMNADDIAYNPFDVPGDAGSFYDSLPETTNNDYFVIQDEVSGHSFSVGWDFFPGADGYRIDVYENFADKDLYNVTLYKYLKSLIVGNNVNMASVDGLSTNTYYTVVLVPLKNGRGIAIYPPTSIYTQAQLVGDMLYDMDEIYKHPWFNEPKGNEEDYSSDITDSSQNKNKGDKKTLIKRIIKKRRKPTDESSGWIIAIIVISAVVTAGAGITVILLLKRRKKVLLLTDSKDRENTLGGGISDE